MKKIGIYCIENVESNKKYIGSSTNCEHRWYIHKWQLKKNNHPNIHLQYSWNLYGEQNFLFYIIEETTEDLLLEKEKYYIDKYNVLNESDGYNISIDPSAPMKGRKHSKKSIEKMSSVKTGEQNSFFGKHHSEETKRKIREKKIGKKLSEEHRKKVIKTLKGGEESVNAKLTMEIVRSIREEYKLHKCHGIIRKIAEKYNVNESTIGRVVKNLTWKEEAKIENPEE